MFSKSNVFALFVPNVAFAAAHCTASSLVVHGVSYDCTTQILDGHASVHWSMMDDGLVDLAFETDVTTGWLGMGWGKPGTENKMGGAHAIVAVGLTTHFLSLSAMPFPALDPTDMRVPFESAASVTQGGKTIITVNGTNVSSSNCSFIVAHNDNCTWPCNHTMTSYYELDLHHGKDMYEARMTSTTQQATTSSTTSAKAVGSARTRESAGLLAAGAMSLVVLARV